MRRPIIAACVLLAAGAVQAQPIEIAKQGFFYAGGVRSEDGKTVDDQPTKERSRGAGSGG